MQHIKLRAIWNNILSVEVDNIEFRIYAHEYMEDWEVSVRATPEEMEEWKEFHDEYPYSDSVSKCNTVSNDAAIVFMHNAIYKDIDVDNLIRITAKTYFWPIHDIFHAMNDVSGSEVYTNNYIEEQRIKQTINWFNSNCLFIDTDLDELEVAFKSRFNQSIDLVCYNFNLKSKDEEE